METLKGSTSLLSPSSPTGTRPTTRRGVAGEPRGKEKNKLVLLKNLIRILLFFPQESLSVNNRRLENYLSRQQQQHQSADDFECSMKPMVGDEQPVVRKALVRRQASKCSSITASASAPFRRNMEAVGEFEKVWSWDNNNNNHSPSKSSSKGNNNKSSNGSKGYGIPLTRELSPEFSRSSGGGGGGGGGKKMMMSPVERKSRKNPEIDVGVSGRYQRGLSSPAELRRHNNHRDHGHHHNRRAASPELKRSSSRVGGVGDNNGGPVRVLRREKTSLFDNRYPSLDYRSDKRRSYYEEADLRRRSYHELNGGPPAMVMHMAPLQPPPPPAEHNFVHSGKSGKAKKSDYARYPGLDKSNAVNRISSGPPQVIPPGMHPPAVWAADPRGFYHLPPHAVIAAGPPPPGPPHPRHMRHHHHY